MPKSSKGRFMDRTTPPRTATLILITCCAALSMNLFLPSLPRMTADFGTAYGIMQVAVSGYLAVNAVFQLVIGPLSDRYGRRNTLLVCIAIFVLASIGCALATDIWTFLAFRMMQATIVAGIVLPRAVIRDMFQADRAAAMIGWVTMGMSVAPMIAPAFGGLLDGVFGWQASFWTLGILGALTFWLTWSDLGETSVSNGESLRQQMSHYPELFGSPRFWGYAGTAALSSGAFFAYLGGAPYVGSEVFGMTPTMLGLYFGAPALGYMLGNGLSGSLSARVGFVRMVVAGCIVTAIGLGTAIAVVLTVASTPETFFGFMTLVGLGNGLVIPNATAGALSVRPDLAGTASGLSGSIMIGGGAALSTLAGILLTGATTSAPLLWLMFTTSALSIVTITLTVRRERRLAAMPSAAE